MSSSNRIQTHRKSAVKGQGGCCHYCGVRMWLVSPEELQVGPRSEAARAKLRLRTPASSVLSIESACAIPRCPTVRSATVFGNMASSVVRSEPLRFE